LKSDKGYDKMIKTEQTFFGDVRKG